MSRFRSGCGGGGGGGGSPAPGDAARPLVILTAPSIGALLPVGNKLTATFDEAMDPATINTTTFTLAPTLTAWEPVVGTVTSVGQTVIFTPTGAIVSLFL